MKHFSHLNTATQIVQQYTGEGPLHHFLKSFFSHHKKFGSNDRKRISHLCYQFYRVVRGFREPLVNIDSKTVQERILAGTFLCSHKTNDLLAAIKPTWNDNIGLRILEKVNIIHNEIGCQAFDVKNIFPAAGELSTGVDKENFIVSHLQQPDLFIRVRPGYENAVIESLRKLDVQFDSISTAALRLPNGFNINQHFELDREVVVQDLSSQRVGALMKLSTTERNDDSKNQLAPISIWDCCAASGGKSIMAKDILRNIDLTVSDIRESILINLKKRFKIAGIKEYRTFIADLSTADYKRGNVKYDLIIADLPCTGSGTWSRTPEQLYFFKPSAIDKYSDLQKKIVGNAIPHLNETGKLLYVTCSVFKKENEDIIGYLLQNFRLQLEKMELIAGYENKADTLFAALLSRLP